jgi:PadR family transcriptional regulator PadR
MGTEKPKADLLPGTLDMLVLKTLMRGHLHGVCDRLYLALQRLELYGWIEG